MRKAAKILLITVLLSGSFKASAQLLTNLGKYHNQVFVNTGYYLSFANYSVGWLHKGYVKFLRKELVGILDFSIPYSDKSNTKFVFRKGFQMNVWGKNDFRIPIALISSSDKVVTNLLRVHNFVTDLFFNPGIYRAKYTIALDIDYKVIWVSAHHKVGSTEQQDNNNWLSHVRTKFAAGIAMGLNSHRFTYMFRGGYQETADLQKDPYAFYAIFQLGYNCNFRKHKEDTKVMEEEKK